MTLPKSQLGTPGTPGPDFDHNRVHTRSNAVYGQNASQLFQVFRDEARRLLESCRSIGVTLWEDSGSLRYRGPDAVLTPELLAALGKHKETILALLVRGSSESETNDGPAPVASKPPTDWSTLAAQRWGPGLADPSPGLIVDVPDPARRRLALEGVEPPPRRVVADPPPEPDPDAELLDAIVGAGFRPVGLSSAAAPAWVDDDALTVTPAEVRRSVELERAMHPRSHAEPSTDVA
jgi:hypothetical protein